MVSTVLAVVAFLISAFAFEGQVQDIQKSRVQSATDSCYILRILVLHAYQQSHVVAANDLLKSVGLQNCIQYGESINTLNGR